MGWVTEALCVNSRSWLQVGMGGLGPSRPGTTGSAPQDTLLRLKTLTAGRAAAPFAASTGRLHSNSDRGTWGRIQT